MQHGKEKDASRCRRSRAVRAKPEPLIAFRIDERMRLGESTGGAELFPFTMSLLSPAWNCKVRRLAFAFW
jgi:hypothetical protein